MLVYVLVGNLLSYVRVCVCACVRACACVCVCVSCVLKILEVGTRGGNKVTSTGCTYRFKVSV